MPFSNCVFFTSLCLSQLHVEPFHKSHYDSHFKGSPGYDCIVYPLTARRGQVRPMMWKRKFLRASQENVFKKRTDHTGMCFLPFSICPSSLLTIQNHYVSTSYFSALENLWAVSKQPLDCKSDGEKYSGPSSRSSKWSLFVTRFSQWVNGGE